MSAIDIRPIAGRSRADLGQRPCRKTISDESFLLVAAKLRHLREALGVSHDLCHLAPPEDAIATQGGLLHWGWIIFPAALLSAYFNAQAAFHADCDAADVVYLYKLADS